MSVAMTVAQGGAPQMEDADLASEAPVSVSDEWSSSLKVEVPWSVASPTPVVSQR